MASSHSTTSTPRSRSPRLPRAATSISCRRWCHSSTSISPSPRDQASSGSSENSGRAGRWRCIAWSTPTFIGRPRCRCDYDLGYLGTYSADRQPALERLLLAPARQLPMRRFVVAGAQYPRDIDWPDNVERLEHVAPADHSRFYGSMRFTLNVTRANMVAAGHSPSVRLFEAAACGTPLISDRWIGLDRFFPQGRAIIVADRFARRDPRPDRARRGRGERDGSEGPRDHAGAAHRPLSCARSRSRAQGANGDLEAATRQDRMSINNSCESIIATSLSVSASLVLH